MAKGRNRVRNPTASSSGGVHVRHKLELCIKGDNSCHQLTSLLQPSAARHKKGSKNKEDKDFCSKVQKLLLQKQSYHRVSAKSKA